LSSKRFFNTPIFENSSIYKTFKAEYCLVSLGMPSLKNVLFTLFVVLALAGGVWAYFKLKEIKKPSEDALQRLPAGCSVYLYTHNVFELNNRLNTRSLIVDKFSDLPPLSDILRTLSVFCAKATENDVLEETFNDNGIHFAMYPDKKFWLISFNLKELGQEHLFQTSFSETFITKKLDTEQYSFELESLGHCFIRFHEGGVCISNSRQGIVAAYDSEMAKLNQDAAFKTSASEFEESETLNIYIAHQNTKQSDAAFGFNALQNSGFTSGQIELLPSQLVLNGSLYPEKNPLFEILLSQKPAQPELQNMLPANCTSFKAFGFQTFTTFSKNDWQSPSTKKFWETINDSALYDVQSSFYDNLVTSVCEFTTAWNLNPHVVCIVSDTLKANEHLLLMSDSILSIGNEKLYRIKNSVQAIQLLEPFSHANCAYAFVFDGYLYFCESRESAVLLSQTLNTGNTLEKNPELMAYAAEQFPEAFNLLIYTRPFSSPQTITGIYPAAKNSAPATFKNLKHACVSLVSIDTHFKFRWQCASENEAEDGGEKLLWTLKLDTVCSMSPQEFVNHLSGEQELVVQDDANTLYLINSKGKILWKKALKEKIRSKIYRVDMFKNNKFQMLFSTDNYIHLIDRNSNYVEAYPFKTPTKISSALRVFDYDESRDYRLMFACVNKKIYNYTIYGLRNEKFIPVKTEHEVELPIQYVKIGPSDYLLAIDREGKIYAISRKGELRLQLSNRTLVPCREVYVDISKNLQTSKLIYVDEKEGTLHKISLSDKKEILSLNAQDAVRFYTFGLIDENRNMDLVIAEPEELIAYNLNGNRLFDTKLPFELSEVNFYSDQNHAVYYGWNRNNSELYLYESRKNESLSLKAGAMPLFSNLFKNNKIYLVYPENDGLNCLAY
jgi:hypothetical protein